MEDLAVLDSSDIAVLAKLYAAIAEVALLRAESRQREDILAALIAELDRLRTDYPFEV